MIDKYVVAEIRIGSRGQLRSRDVPVLKFVIGTIVPQRYDLASPGRVDRRSVGVVMLLIVGIVVIDASLVIDDHQVGAVAVGVRMNPEFLNVCGMQGHPSMMSVEVVSLPDKYLPCKGHDQVGPSLILLRNHGSRDFEIMIHRKAMPI